MFDAAECMFMYVESSLRVGSGEERPRDRPADSAGSGDRLPRGARQQPERGVAGSRPVAASPCGTARPARLRARRATRSSPAAWSSPMPSPCCSRSAP